MTSPVRVGCAMRCDALPRMCTDDTRAAAASAIEDIDVAIAEINSLVVACPPAPQLTLRKGQLVADTATVAGRR